MPKAKLTCDYCGHNWLEYVYLDRIPKCQSCGDKNVKVSRPTNTDPFGYTKDKPKETK